MNISELDLTSMMNDTPTKNIDLVDKISEEVMSAKEFIYVYNSSTTLNEVLEKTGLEQDAVTQRAKELSKRGINMRIFPKEEDWEELASFAQKVLDTNGYEGPKIVKPDDDDEIDVGNYIGLVMEDEEVFGIILEFDDDEGLVTIQEDVTGDIVAGYQDDMFIPD